MKKWVLKVGDKESVCELITAFVSSSFRLKLKYNGKVFMAEFRDRDTYLESRDGGWRKIKIYTINKKITKWGIARFTEFYKKD